MELQEKKTVTIVKGTGSQFRWVAITALLLAIGSILRIVSPSIAGVTPNWSIAMYCLAIILIRPSLAKAAGIGMVAGAIGLITSKSIFPYGNLVSELVGAVACASILKIRYELKIANINIMPAICGLLATLASGFTFVTVAKLALGIPQQVYLYAMLPVVATVAGANTVITQLLYFPAHKIFANDDVQGADLLVSKGDQHESR